MRTGPAALHGCLALTPCAELRTVAAGSSLSARDLRGFHSWALCATLGPNFFRSPWKATSPPPCSVAVIARGSRLRPCRIATRESARLANLVTNSCFVKSTPPCDSFRPRGQNQQQAPDRLNHAFLRVFWASTGRFPALFSRETSGACNLFENLVGAKNRAQTNGLVARQRITPPSSSRRRRNRSPHGQPFWRHASTASSRAPPEVTRRPRQGHISPLADTKTTF